MSPRDNNDRDYTFSKVPSHVRKGFLPMFFIMLGFTVFSSSMSVGAKLGLSLDLKTFCLAVLCGGVILAVYTGVLAYIGSLTGLSFDLLARRAFGKYGSFLPSGLIAITQIGWFGVGVAMFATAAADVIGCNRWILVVIAGTCMTMSAYFGIKGMEIVSYIAVPLVMILGMHTVLKALNEGGGVAGIFGGHVNELTLVEAIGLVVGSFISGGTTTPNFARFSTGKRSAVITTVFAFFIGNSLMFVFGAVGGAFTGKDDIFYVMIEQGLTVQALIVLGANIWTTNDNTIYSSALGLSNITKRPKRPMVIVGGVIGTLASVWVYDHFINWLSILNILLPPVGAVIMIDFFCRRKSYLDEDYEESVINLGAVIGVVVGALVGGLFQYGINNINSMIAACLCYILFNIKTLIRNNTQFAKK